MFSRSSTFNFFGSAALAFLFIFKGFSQETQPVNSNYLINQGVSPRVLDFAANSALQDGRFKENVKLTVSSNGQVNEYQFQSIYDPAYTEGMDMRFVVDGSMTSKKDIKLLTELIKNQHHFSRLVEQYLYDESTLNLVKNENESVVFEFYYRKVNVDPSMNHIKRLKGFIYFVNGELDHVELVNTKPLKKGIKKYSREVYFQRAQGGGGHFVTRVKEMYDVERGKNIIQLSAETTTVEYANDTGDVLYSEEDRFSDTFQRQDTLSVKLGGVLPFFGKPAVKLGYQLPRPVGVSVFTHLQAQDLQFTGLSIGVNGEDLVALDDLFLLEESSLRQTTVAFMVKGDAWIFPFLNVMVLAGRAENRVDGDLVLTDEVKALLGLLGQEDVPDALPIVTDVTTNLYGGGATLAGGLGDFNFTLAYQVLVADAFEVNTVTTAQALTALVGYMLPFGMNVMVGGQGQFYDTGIGGSIPLEDSKSLDFLVDFEPQRWNFFGGIYKGFAKHWEITLQAGMGSRSSITAMLGYRF